MRSALDVILTRYGDYFADSGFGLLFVVCLLFLFLWKKDREIHNALFWPAAVLTIVVFCPVSGFIIMKLDEASVYWRVYWLLPVVLLAAFAATKLVYLVKGRGKQILLGLVCIVIVAVNGTFVFSDTYFEKKENNYKLPTEVIWVADAINEHAEENRIKKKDSGAC